VGFTLTLSPKWGCDKEDIIFVPKLELFSIGTINLLEII
jgi:hypothetical protein